jgi:alanine-glyoxylate transaminase/serine-glyoxylate transaminase/serine-pyruvate transaminase
MAPKYFRVGHMGTCSANDILATLGAIERGLTASGYKLELGTAISAAQKALG